MIFIICLLLLYVFFIVFLSFLLLASIVRVYRQDGTTIVEEKCFGFNVAAQHDHFLQYNIMVLVCGNAL